MRCFLCCFRVLREGICAYAKVEQHCMKEEGGVMVVDSRRSTELLQVPCLARFAVAKTCVSHDDAQGVCLGYSNLHTAEGNGTIEDIVQEVHGAGLDRFRALRSYMIVFRLRVAYLRQKLSG